MSNVSGQWRIEIFHYAENGGRPTRQKDELAIVAMESMVRLNNRLDGIHSKRSDQQILADIEQMVNKIDILYF